MEEFNFNEKLNQLLQMIDNECYPDASEIYTQLCEHYTETATNLETAVANAAKLTESVEKLRKVNGSLLLKVGHKAEPEPETVSNEELEKVLKFEDLFNEKGELI